MKILHVIRGMENSSGVTHVIVSVTEELARLGIDVTVFYIYKNFESAVEPKKDLVKSQCFPLSARLPDLGVSLEFAKTLTRRINEFDFVHIHAVWNFPTYIAMRAALKAGVPYMVTPHGSFEPWALRQNYWRKLVYGWATEKRLLNRATFLQALTIKEEEQFRQYGVNAPTVVIPNGIDLRLFKKSAKRPSNRYSFPLNHKILLFLSRIHPKKGLDLLIPAFARLLSSYKDVTLVIAGHDGGTGYKTTIREMVTSYGIDSNCVFVGEVKGVKKHEILSISDVFVLPSYSEGLPVAVLEAMGSGLPVVITHNCNIPEVQKKQAGYVVDATSSSVCEALGTILSDPLLAREMGDNGTRLVRSKFSWKKIASQLSSVYEKPFS